MKHTWIKTLARAMRSVTNYRVVEVHLKKGSFICMKLNNNNSTVCVLHSFWQSHSRKGGRRTPLPTYTNSNLSVRTMGHQVKKKYIYTARMETWATLEL